MKKCRQFRKMREIGGRSALDGHTDSGVTPLGVAERTVRTYLNCVRGTRSQATDHRGGFRIRDRHDGPCGWRGATGADLSAPRLIIFRAANGLWGHLEFPGNTLIDTKNGRRLQGLWRRASGGSRCKRTGKELCVVPRYVVLMQEEPSPS